VKLPAANASAVANTQFAAVPPEETVIPPINRSAIIETLVFLIAAVLIDLMFGDGVRFINMQLHPFWIIVLVVTVQYGPVEALISAILASAFLLVGNMPEQSMSETMYEYILRATLTPFLWVVTALVLGSIRARQREEKKNLLNQLWKSEQAAAAIVENYKAAKQSKERLELRLAEERCSVLTVYEVARTLETLDPNEAMAGVEKLVRVALNPKKFSLYRWKNNALALDTAYDWSKDDNYEHRFTAGSMLTRRVLRDNQVLSIVREDDEKILAGQGMLAGPIVDESTGAIFGMLKIEEIGFTDLGIRTHEVFRLVCTWIARVCVNINKYEDAAQHKPAAAKTKAKKKKRVKSEAPPVQAEQPDIVNEPTENAA
ncbi:MAG: hypothetical protein AB7H77_09360, partial [Bdellovibrionales bacterium]